MRVAKLVVVSSILAIGSVGVAYAQSVNPLSVLDESRRDRLELDKRIARDQAAQRQKEQAAQAAQANAQRKVEEGRAASATSFGGATPPSQPEASTERVPGAPGSASAVIETSALTPSVATREPTALPPSSPTDAGGGTAPGSGVVLPAAQAPSAVNETPAPNQAAASSTEANVGTPASTPTRVLITVDKAAQRLRVTCPSSDNLRRGAGFRSGGSGSSGFEVKRP